MIWKLGIKNSKRYSIEVATGSENSIYKYSKYAVVEIKNDLAHQEDKTSYLKAVSKEYQLRRKG
jgi:hypothetical protein